MTEAERRLALGPWVNWLWLADIPSRENALCLEGGNGTATALENHFTTVERASLDPGSWSRAGYDLVVMGAVVTHDGRNSIPDSLWRACHEALHPGGCLMVTEENPLWYHRSRRGMAFMARRLRAGRHRRAMRRGGFQETRKYYLAPSYEEPQTIVPVDRRIIAGYEEIEMKLATRRGLRSRLSRLGLHAALYPLIMHLANR